MRYLPILFLWLLSTCTSNKPEERAEISDVYYSCSMHPQIMESKPGKCPICQMPLTAVKKSEVKDDEIQLSDQQIQLGNISVDTIRTGNTESQTVLTTVLNFDQTKTSAISSRVMGRIERLYFKNIGDYVRTGDRLYDLYSEELNNAKEEYLLIVRSRKTLVGNNAVDYSSLLRSARSKLQLWGLGNAQISQLERSGKANATTSYYSTGSGYITVMDVRQGDYVMEGGTIVQLADLSTVWAEAQVFTSQHAQIEPGASVRVRIPELGDEDIHGTISFVNPEVVAESRINLLRVSIPNKNHKLKPGMAAYVYLNASKNVSVTLPVEAVVRDAKGATVWVRTGNNTFKNKMVELGAEANSRVEIKSGLQPGDFVVVSGAYLLNSEYIFKKGANPMEGMKM